MQQQSDSMTALLNTGVSLQGWRGCFGINALSSFCGSIDHTTHEKGNDIAKTSGTFELAWH